MRVNDGSIPLRDRIADVAGSLSPAQAAVARLVDEAPSVVAFGTVAAVADEAGTSPQTVLRLAARLGHDGFPGLQDEVRRELVARLPPAASRIRQRPGSDLRGEVAAADAGNLAVSLDVAPDAIAAAVDLLADVDRSVAVLAADSWVGVGALFAGHLSQLRDDVRVLDGPVPRVACQIAMLGHDDVVIALDVRRYERWVVEAAQQAVTNGVSLIAVSDGPTSPLFADAAHRFVVGVGSPGPFESATGVVALLHLLVTETAARLRDDAGGRLDAVEQAWLDRDALLD
ncbi:MurR/RpiR family transcriptional regulator [Actinospongicola halichondriae]|uniref:MurR/RpiR family transcriptional regulator n=1 Tax=Actinospongicola halichondriae TaxID=3236844 RepID=UPI003D54BF2A